MWSPSHAWLSPAWFLEVETAVSVVLPAANADEARATSPGLVLVRPEGDPDGSGKCPLQNAGLHPKSPDILLAGEFVLPARTVQSVHLGISHRTPLAVAPPFGYMPLAVFPLWTAAWDELRQGLALAPKLRPTQLLVLAARPQNRWTEGGWSNPQSLGRQSRKTNLLGRASEIGVWHFLGFVSKPDEAQLLLVHEPRLTRGRLDWTQHCRGLGLSPLSNHWAKEIWNRSISQPERLPRKPHPSHSRMRDAFPTV